VLRDAWLYHYQHSSVPPTNVQSTMNVSQLKVLYQYRLQHETRTMFLLPSYGKETTSARVSGPQSSHGPLDPCGAQQREGKTVTVLRKPPPGAAISLLITRHRS